jgi:hypothetical protein
MRHYGADVVETPLNMRRGSGTRQRPHRIMLRAAVGIAVALVVVLGAVLTVDHSHSKSAKATAPTTTNSPPSATAQRGSTIPPGAISPAVTTVKPGGTCQPSQLSVARVTSSTKPAPGQMTTLIVTFSNVSPLLCVLNGYPRLVLYRLQGGPVASALTPDPRLRPTTVSLAPAGRASFWLEFPGGGFDAACPVFKLGIRPPADHGQISLDRTITPCYYRPDPPPRLFVSVVFAGLAPPL